MLVIRMNRDDGRIMNVCINSIREGHRKCFYENEIDKCEFYEILKYSYLFFKTFGGYGGLAEDIIVNYLRELSKEISLSKPWQWLIKRNLDVDKEKLTLQSKAEHLFLLKTKRFNDIDYKKEIDNILDEALKGFSDERESIEKLSKILQWLSWIKVETEKLYLVTELLKRIVKIDYPDDKWFKWIYFYDRNVYSDFLYLDRMMLKYEYFVPIKTNNLNIRKYIIINIGDIEILYIDNILVVKYDDKFRIFNGYEEVKGVNGDDLQIQSWQGVLRYLKNNGKELKAKDKLYILLNDIASNFKEKLK